MKLFDSHAHYWDEKLKEGSESLLTSLFSQDIGAIIQVATSPETSRISAELSKKYSMMFSALGIHPSDAQFLKGTAYEEIAKIEELVLDPLNKCVAIGEIGLDYHYEDTNKDLQKEYFEKQMQLAERLNMPVVIHDRDAHGDCFDMICKYPKVRGVFHSYSGSLEMAKDLIRRGWYISFSGTISFKNAPKVREVALGIDKNKVLIETDCPYLTPTPFRGQINHSGYLVYTCKALADVWGLSLDDTAKITWDNAVRFFNLKI